MRSSEVPTPIPRKYRLPSKQRRKPLRLELLYKKLREAEVPTPIPKKGHLVFKTSSRAVWINFPLKAET